LILASRDPIDRRPDSVADTEYWLGVAGGTLFATAVIAGLCLGTVWPPLIGVAVLALGAVRLGARTPRSSARRPARPAPPGRFADWHAEGFSDGPRGPADSDSRPAPGRVTDRRRVNDR
jgi:hypothetical protein